MRIAAFYVSKGYLPNIFGKNHKEVTINLGGKNLYEFVDGELEKSVPNQYFIDDLLSDHVSLFSCIVGNNGGGKTTLLHEIANSYHCKYVIENENGEYEVRDNVEHMHRIYFTPYLNHKTPEALRNNGKDLSKLTLLRLDNHGDSDLLNSFLENHNSKNIKRWIEFNQFYTGVKGKKIILPTFNQIKFNLNHFKSSTTNPTQFGDTANQIRPALTILFGKIKNELREKVIELGKQENLSQDKNKLERVLKFEYSLYDTALGKFVEIMEHAGNYYLDEGIIDENFEDTLDKLPVREGIKWFLEHSGVYSGIEQYLFTNQLTLLELIDYVGSLANPFSITDNWRIIRVNEEQALRIIQLYDSFNNSFDKEWFNYDAKPMFLFEPVIVVSSGEQAFLNLFSTLYYHAQNIKNGIDIDYHSTDSLSDIDTDILLLLDEGDNAFHPQWKKEYVQYLREIMPLIFKDYRIQIIITSHDPLTLSDFPKNNVVFLDKSNGVTRISNSSVKRTLGANITDLLKDSFFMHDGQIGSFIAQIIDEIITECRNGELHLKRIIEIERIINCIDEPILRFKLAEILSEAIGNKSFERQLIDKEIERLTERRKST